MCVCELPISEKRKEHISQIANQEFKDLVESCVQSRPKRRPDMQEIIDKLEACYDNHTKKQKEKTTQPLQKDVAEKTNKQMLFTKTDIAKATIATAKKQDSTQQSPDWLISRDQIQLTDKILGRGAWATVSEGRYCGCSAAVKNIHELIFSAHIKSLFEREIDIASRCRHPCLLQFIGATNDGGIPLLVTELMESSLRQLLGQRHLSTTEISVISLDVAGALTFLHQKKPSPIIHRNINSAYVLLWRQGNQWRGKLSVSFSVNFQQQAMTSCPGSVLYGAPESLTPKQTVKVG